MSTLTRGVATSAQPEAEEEAPPRDRPFNPWRCPVSESAKLLVAEVTREVQNLESYYKERGNPLGRLRARKENDQRIFEATVSAIVCDLCHHQLTGHEGRVFVTR